MAELLVVIRQDQMLLRRRKARRSNGSMHLMMRSYEIRRVPYARRNSNLRGRRKYRTGSGRMPSRSAAACTMQAAIVRLPRTAPPQDGEAHLQCERVPQTLCWVSEKQRYVKNVFGRKYHGDTHY